MHPNGAEEWSDVLLSLLNYAKQYSRVGKFRWYTMTDLAKFNQRRQEVKWSESNGALGWRVFNMTHTDKLDGMTLMLPKNRYTRPIVLSGIADIREQNGNWLITAKYSRRISFASYPL
jgi:hypothetical protein